MSSSKRKFMRSKIKFLDGCNIRHVIGCKPVMDKIIDYERIYMCMKSAFN